MMVYLFACLGSKDTLDSSVKGDTSSENAVEYILDPNNITTHIDVTKYC